MKVLLLSLGRRGGSVRFGYELFAAAQAQPGLEAKMIIARGSENAADFERFGTEVLRLPTLDGKAPWTLAGNFLALRGHVLGRIAAGEAEAVVAVMPHLFTPLLAPAVRRKGALYATIIHDAEAHPGDPTAVVTRWLRSEAKGADLVVTLSRQVADRLAALRIAPRERILPLFHPDMGLHEPASPPAPREGPLRLLFFGRILGYKGLPLLVSAVELLQSQGVPIRLGVAGAGELGDLRPRLEALGAEIANRWHSEAEMAEIFRRYDAVALPYVEASQSGVAAVAFAHGLPVVATPVGGIVEQVEHGVSGILAASATAEAFAAAVKRLAEDSALHARLAHGLRAGAEGRSWPRFIDALVGRLRSLR